MKYNPLVSVIVNCHNGERYIKEAITSILNQTYKNFELIIWDNCSSDKTKYIIESIIDRRIRYFYSDTKVTLYHARNLALNVIQGDLITFLDVDDVWLTSKLAVQVEKFRKNTSLGVVYSNYLIKNEFNSKTKKRKWFALPKGYIINYLLKDYCIGLLTIMINRNVFSEDGYKFNPSYDIIGDFELMMKLSIKYEFDSINRPLAIYRLHDKNISNNKEREIYELKKWYSENEHSIDLKKSRNLEYLRYKIRYLEILSNINKLEYIDLLQSMYELKYPSLIIKLLIKFILGKIN